MAPSPSFIAVVFRLEPPAVVTIARSLDLAEARESIRAIPPGHYGLVVSDAPADACIESCLAPGADCARG